MFYYLSSNKLCLYFSISRSFSLCLCLFFFLFFAFCIYLLPLLSYLVCSCQNVKIKFSSALRFFFLSLSHTSASFRFLLQFLSLSYYFAILQRACHNHPKDPLDILSSFLFFSLSLSLSHIHTHTFSLFSSFSLLYIPYPTLITQNLSLSFACHIALCQSAFSHCSPFYKLSPVMVLQLFYLLPRVFVPCLAVCFSARRAY